MVGVTNIQMYGHMHDKHTDGQTPAEEFCTS